MAWYDLDLGNFNLGGGGLPDLGGLDPSQFNLNWANGGNWFDGNMFNLGPLNVGGDPQTGWPGGQDFSSWPSGGPEGPGSGFDWDKFLKGGNTTLDTIGKVGQLAEKGFGAWQGIERVKAMHDYQERLKNYEKQVQDYYDQRKQYEAKFASEFDAAKEGFEGANEEFQGQLGEARGAAESVMGQFLETAKPLLAQSQELLVPAVAALARGEEPEILKPVLAQATQRATATAVQSMVSAGMSPEAAMTAVQPMVDQMAHEMLLKQATAMVTQGTAIGEQGQRGLQGAGMMSELLGKLAAMGMNPYTAEFQAMLQAFGNILSSDRPPPPPMAPVA